MNTNEIMMLGLGLQAPWKLVSQKLDVEKNPYELQLDVAELTEEVLSRAQLVVKCVLLMISKRKSGII